MVESLASLWEKLTAPHPALVKPDDRHTARLASSIVLPVLALGILNQVIRLFVDVSYFSSSRFLIYIITMIGFGVAYGLSRTRDYKRSMMVLIGFVYLYGIFAPLVTSADPAVVFLMAGAPLAGAIFFSLRAVIVLTAISVTAAVGVGASLVSPDEGDLAIIAGFTIAVLSAALIMFIKHRDFLEGLHRSELEHAVLYAEAATAEAEAAAIDAEAARQAVEDANQRIQQASEERDALQQQVIDAQRRSLAELSSPVIPLLDGILLMPLIGTMDSQRAQDIMRGLLRGISMHNTQVVLLDITGVPVMDTAVAKYLNQTIQAAQLKGACCIITGMSDAVAETIVDLGIDWTHVETMRDLQAGLLLALERVMTGQTIKDS